MDSKLRRHLSTFSASLTKTMAWLPRLGLLSPSNVSQVPPTSESFVVPGSLRDAHNAACAWFFGPNAENADYFKMHVEAILSDVVQCRRDFSPEDEDFIDAEAVSSHEFKKSMSKLRTNLTLLSGLLSQHSVPFYSPRYIAHMVNDVSMPATLGYLMGLMYNPNNISPEAAPLVHIIEYDVGQQLCSMLGYNTQLSETSSPLEAGPKAWGHITCGGSVANLESMWVARNLKFYPLALKRAADNEPCLAHVASHFKVTLCTERKKVLVDCDTWDLLNLTPSEVASLITNISVIFGLSAPALQTILNNYLIQTTGKDDLEKYFEIQQPPQYLCPKTAHYSWPKGAAVTGIGSRNIIKIAVDEQARLDCHALDMLLAECMERRQAVYAVVVTMGTTEYGSVDPLSKVLALRRKYQRRGLSFLIHVDAAWGGYFRSMLIPNPAATDCESHLDDPTLFLNTYTKNELRQLRLADTITIDPHKSGYTPFPAGGLCYKDGRLRYMVTWTSPVIGSVEGAMKMGVYGIEGSKPGAAPLAAWLGHEVIGLHKGGYGFLLGQSVLTSTRLYGHWATMSLDHPTLLVVPFRMLPSEMVSDTSAEKVDEERRFIRDTLLECTREELAEDPEACAMMRQMGPDLVVNAYACNFRIDGVINQDVSEANLLNARIYDRLSFKSLSEKLDNRKIIVMSSVLSQREYGACLTKFKERLGLSGEEDLYVLASVSMSPFIAPSNFEQVLANTFREVAEEEAEISVARNRTVPALRAFVLQGTNPIGLVHMPCFGAATQRVQCILSGELSDAGLKAYIEAKSADPTATYVARTLEREKLSAIIQRKSFRCSISKLTTDSTSPISESLVTNISVIKKRRLASNDLDISYPSKMPFYLYGTPQELHIDHLLLRAPNAQISSGEVAIELVEGSQSVFTAGLKNGLIVLADTLPERLMQPLVADCLSRFFRPGAKLDVSVYHDQNQGRSLCDNLGEPIARAAITLCDNTFADAYMINIDAPVFTSQAPEKCMAIPENTETLQDHPLFRGHGRERPIDRHTSTRNPKGWREVWDRALASRQSTDDCFNSDTNSILSAASDINNNDHWSNTSALSRTLAQIPFF